MDEHSASKIQVDVLKVILKKDQLYKTCIISGDLR